jgi:hypothetical protein
MKIEAISLLMQNGRLNTFYSPIKPIAFPPTFPIPGASSTGDNDDISASQWPSHPLPSYAGQTFTALCQLWAIMQEVAAAYFAHRLDDTSQPIKAPLAFAEAKYQKLLHLTSTFTPDISRNKHSSDHIIAYQYV